MKPIYYILSAGLIAASMFFFSCKATKEAPRTYEGDQIIFGSGGGFTGKWDIYGLLDNGQLFDVAKDGDMYKFTYNKKLKKKATATIFEQIKNMDLMNKKSGEAGNMSRMLEFRSGNRANKIVWKQTSDNNMLLDKLYNQLLDSMK